jgi:hypothetical protein
MSGARHGVGWCDAVAEARAALGLAGALGKRGSGIIFAVVYGFAMLPVDDDPSPRRLRWVRRTLGFGFLPICIVSFYLIENFRGDRGWAAAKADLAAAGISLNFFDYIPDPAAIPDEENVAAAEPYVRLAEEPDLEPENPFSGTLMEIRTLKAGSFSSGEAPEFAKDSSSAAVDPSSPAAAQELLNLLSVHDELLSQIRAACARPQARFTVVMDDHGLPRLPQQAYVRNTASILRSRAVALIAVGRSSEALDDLRLLLRQADLTHAPNLLCLLTRRITISTAVTPVWYGLARDAWTDADLRALEQLWANIDLEDHLSEVIRAEHALMQGNLEKMALNRQQASRDLEVMASLVAGSVFDSSTRLGRFRVRAFAALFPTGWLRQNQAWFATKTLAMLAELGKNPDESNQYDLFIDAQTRSFIENAKTTPYNFIARQLWPVLGSVLSNRRQLIADIALLRAAIAIEQHRRATGRLPEALAELAAPPPVDPINGEALRYQRLDDRRYKLWSVALNGTDEGGKNEDHRSSSPDWVWRSWIEPAKPSKP